MTKSSVLLSLGIVAGLAACIEDPAAIDDQFALTQEDARLLGLNFWRQALEIQLDADLDGQPATSGAAPLRAPEVFTSTDTTVVACSLDGEIEQIVVATATVDVETEELELDARMTLTHDGCREEIDGRTFSFFGAPSMGARVTILYGPGNTQTWSGGIEGAAVVITQGAPVLCTADLSAGPATTAGDSITYAITGSFCGETFDETVTEGIN